MSIYSLPYELLLYLGEYLSLRDLVLLARTSKLFHDIFGYFIEEIKRKQEWNYTLLVAIETHKPLSAIIYPRHTKRFFLTSEEARSPRHFVYRRGRTRFREYSSPLESCPPLFQAKNHLCYLHLKEPSFLVTGISLDRQRPSLGTRLQEATILYP